MAQWSAPVLVEPLEQLWVQGLAARMVGKLVPGLVELSVYLSALVLAVLWETQSAQLKEAPSVLQMGLAVDAGVRQHTEPQMAEMSAVMLAAMSAAMSSET